MQCGEIFVPRDSHDRLLRDVGVSRHRLSRSPTNGSNAQLRIRSTNRLKNLRRLAQGDAEEMGILRRLQELLEFRGPCRRAVCDDVVHALTRLHALALLHEDLESTVREELDVGGANLRDISLATRHQPQQHQEGTDFRIRLKVEGLLDVLRRRRRLVDRARLAGKVTPGAKRRTPDSGLGEIQSSLKVQREFARTFWN